MKIDAMLTNVPGQAAEVAVGLEAAGYDAAWAPETNHDPFLPLVAAAARTRSIGLGTSVAVAFARNPMNLAQLAWDVQCYSGGRMTLGLGSQIKPHITRRYSMPWGQPAARMRETVLAIRAIWDAWLGNSELDFQGEFFTHTLMTPPMTPDPDDLAGAALPKIFVAGVGPLMIQAAAEVADGLIVHSFHTVAHLDAATMPVLRSGDEAGTAGRTVPFEVFVPVFVGTGETDEQSEAAADALRQWIAFYGSTPAYRAVLETHGWGDLQTELHALSKQDRWDEMKTLISDEVLNEFAIVRPPGEVAAELLRRYAGRADRVSFNAPYDSDPDLWVSVLRDVRRLAASARVEVASRAPETTTVG